MPRKRTTIRAHRKQTRQRKMGNIKVKTKSPRGMHDTWGRTERFYEFIRFTAGKHLRAGGFERIDTPTLENKDLFVRSIGGSTDIIEKEMFEVKGKEGGSSLVMRPENTAGVARAYIEQGLFTLPQPVMLFYVGKMFRRERPQAGRFREFEQIGVEVLGSDKSAVDTQVVKVLFDIFEDLGLKDINLEINSIGCAEDRPKLKEIIRNYYERKGGAGCRVCKKRIKKNPFRLLDCKEKKCQKLSEGAPQLIDNICEKCKNDFKEILEYLDDLNIPYDLNPRLVRGLDYYTKTVFEVVSKRDKKRTGVLAGGGRYDGLIELLGGRGTPAIGWSLGVDRVVEVLKKEGVSVYDPYKPKVFFGTTW